MTGEDLDCPLVSDACDRCSLPWRACICDAAHPRRQPTPKEIETAACRLSERARGKAA
jgi:hypothetical protein